MRLLLAAFFLIGCANHTTTSPDAGMPSGGNGAGGGGSGGGDMATPPASNPDDPLAQPPAPATGLTDVSADLDAVLEHGMLAGACDRYKAGDMSERLRCGKYMFFYESFGTGGVPTALVQFLIDNFPDDIGPGFAKLGMVADPSSAQHLPLGLAPTVKLGGSVDAVAFTCASCHFGQLPDGRYAVGAPNHKYEYGKQILSLILLPSLGLGGDPSTHDAAAVAAVKPLLDKINADSNLKNKLLATVLPLAGAGGSGAPAMTASDEHHYASWPSGTQDFLIAPLPIDDKVHTVSKISALWAIATPQEGDAQLGWTGGTHSVADFLHGFVLVGGGNTSAWPDDTLTPLRDYILSLRAPANPSPPDAAAVERGRALFVGQCATCHDGPRGMGPRLYDYSEIGTDDAMKQWAMQGVPTDQRFDLTGKLKSPRLVGEWAMSRFLHNGAVPTLESLFCLEARPPAPNDTALGSQGHDMTCTLGDADKHDLIAYLRAR